MSTAPTSPTPPPPPASPPPQQGYYGGSGMGMPPVPVPNPELIVYVIALVVVGILGLAADDTVGATGFVEFATWATAAYLISRGLAKLRNVTER